MVMTLPLVQMDKARREVNRTNQDKHHERSSNVYYTLNPWGHMPLNIKSNEIFFPATTNYRMAFAGVPCETCSENFTNFPEEYSQ